MQNKIRKTKKPRKRFWWSPFAFLFL